MTLTLTTINGDTYVEETVKYSDYKNNYFYSSYETKKNSYDAATKTITVYVPTLNFAIRAFEQVLTAYGKSYETAQHDYDRCQRYIADDRKEWKLAKLDGTEKEMYKKFFEIVEALNK